MKFHLFRRAVSLVALAFACGARTVAFHPSQHAPLPNLDTRTKAAETPEQAEAAKELRARVPGLKVEFDPITRSPKSVASPAGFLTGPDGEGKGVSAKAAGAVAKGEAHRATKLLLNEHSKLFGHGAEALGRARVKREFRSAHNGMTTAVWEQHVDNIEVFEAVLIAHTTSRGELVNVSSQFVPDVERAADRGTPRRAQLLAAPPVSAALALKLAARNLEEKTDDEPMAVGPTQGNETKRKFTATFLRGEADAKLVWLPLDRDTLRLCWDVSLTVRGRTELYRLLVDAHTGEVRIRRCLTEYLSNATYRVFTSDSPSPFSPGNPTPLTNQPPLLSRSLVTLSALDTNASPDGWIADANNETLGNNVDAHTDTDANNIPDLPRPTGSPFRVFDPPLDLLTQQPSNYRNAAVVQLFYYCNWMHDKLYQLGFTEAAGNFQTDNFGRGGFGNDPVQADAQDGSGVNNANMSTPSDGSPPRMQMYVFTGPNPDRDGDFDGEIVLHEYTHGLSNRRVGGGGGLSALQSRGMGEGWSDWYGLALLSESSDDPDGVYAAGGYATYQFASPTFLQNYYFGIRRYPYSTDLSKNPLTFKDIDPAQASSHAGVPISPIFGGGGAAQVHNQGEVWCVTLWEARAKLIAKHGFTVGNQLILQLVTDGMNLSPPNPNFLQARDAIIQADQVLTGGANRLELWSAFAKRGMGANATSPSSLTTGGVRESYDMPDDLLVTPHSGFTSSGPVGGPFTVSATTFALTNTGAATLNWMAVNTSSWLNVSSVSGTLPPGSAAATVSASLNASASSLPAAVHRASVRFTNVTSGIGTGREFILRVGQPDFFTEVFNSGDFDLRFTTILLTPNGSPSFYSACRDAATNFPTDPTGGAPVFLSDDNFQSLMLTGTNTVGIHNRRSNVLYIGSNGYLTMDSGDSEYYVTPEWHFNRPRVSMLFTDLDPSDGGSISWRELSNRVAITYQNVPEYDRGGFNSFQVEMFFDGRIRMTWLGLDARYGLSGISDGLGMPVAFVESDLSSYAQCITPLLLTAPASATEGAGVLTAQGRIALATALTTSLIVTLSSGDASEINVPSTVTIVGGQTNATFNITVIDDAQLDGTQVAAITASATGFGSASANIAVHDNESATLAISAPAEVVEGGGSTNGYVFVSAPVASPVNIQLTSSDVSAIQVQAIATIAAGQTSAVFSITMPDDIRIDGPQSSILTAHVENWTDGHATITALDNETLNLSVLLAPFVPENGGTSNFGTVSISGTLTTNLVVALQSSAPDQLTVPATVTIPSNQFGGTFTLNLVDNAVLDGSRAVMISASATGFLSGSNTTTIFDDESPPLPSSPTPADFAANVAFNLSQLSWFNGGSGISNDVYFGTNPTPGPAEFQGTVPGSAWLVPSLLAPNTTYYWQVVARKLGVTAGPIWRFTTRGVDHFSFADVPSPQVVNQPFPITVTARDELDRVVSNFTGTVTLRGVPVGRGEVIEDFELGTWPNGQWHSTFGGVIGAQHAHDGTFGLRDPDWSYRTNVVVGNGDSLSWWVRASSTESRAYLGFGASSLGCFSAVVAPNTSQFIIQQNDAYDFDDVAQSTQAWQLNRWYKIVVRFTGANAVTAELYDSDGVTLLNTLSYSGVHTLPGGVAMRSFGGFSLDTIVTGNGRTASIAISPTNSGVFTNGSWRGNLTVLEPATNMHIVATDAASHRGLSTNFSVLVQNDVSVSLDVSPREVALGARITNEITIANGGPAPATGVAMEFVPGGLFVETVSSPSDSCMVMSGRVNCPFGTMAGGTSLKITIVTRADFAGTVTNTVTVTRAEPDGYDGNNAAQVVSTILVPRVRIADATVPEGNSGTTTGYFSLRLFPASASNVTVSFATSDGTATAGSDYLATNGVVMFAPGQTNQVVPVILLGDTNSEPHETFTVTLLSVVNAVKENDSALGTILNDELPPDAYVRSIIGEPWGNPANIAAMNRAFGSNNWQDLRLETVNPLVLFSPITRFIYLEGSDFQALELANFIQANKVAMESWVANGGRLFINGAPNEGDGMDLGFGMTLIYPNGAESARAADELHRVFHGPFTPMTMEFFGDSFAHATINGNGAPLLTNGFGAGVVLVEKRVGTGIVLFGGMTTDNFHDPQPDAANLRANILAYTATFTACTNCPPDLLTQPANQASKPGMSVAFGVTVNGTRPMKFQWRRDGVDLIEGGRFTGTTNATLLIAGAMESDSGNYSVAVSNAFGGVVSSNAALLVSALDHFGWSPIGSPQTIGVPFAALITALNETNGVVTNFTGAVAVSASTLSGLSLSNAPRATSSFTNGSWIGEIAVTEPGTNVILMAVHSSGIAGHSETFHVVASNQRPVIITQPASGFATNGQTLVLSVSTYGALPMSYQWKFFGTNLPAQTNESLVINVTANEAGPYAVEVTNLFGATLSSNAIITVYTPEPLPLFRITALLTNMSGVIEHGYITGDDRGGIALSSQRVFYNGDSGLGRFALGDLSGGANVGGIYDAMVSDLRSGNVYSLANGSVPLSPSGGTITTLLEHDPVTGLLNGVTVPLSRAITITGSYGNVGIFAGYGCVVIHTGTRVYSIALPSGFVMDLGQMYVPEHTFADNWAYWGVAEHDAGTFWLVYVGNNQTIARMAVPGGGVETVANFTHLSDMAAISVSVRSNRWYFHHEYVSQFGGMDESLGYASAAFAVSGTNYPPAFVLHPTNRSVFFGNSASFSALASGPGPLRYQWRKNGTNIFGATNTTFVIPFVQSSDAAMYSVVVANDFGSATSSNATLNLLPPLGTIAVFDDPVYVDTDGTTAAESDNVQATARSLGFILVTTSNLISATNYGAILVPEPENRDLTLDLPPATRAALSNYVFNGGKLVVHGSSDYYTARLLNFLFNFSVFETDDADPSFRTVDAVGTEFAEDPTLLPWNNETSSLLISSLPPGTRAFYTNYAYAPVAGIPVGSGMVLYLGWDWFNAAPQGTQDAGWVKILDSALRQRWLPPANPSGAPVVVFDDPFFVDTTNAPAGAESDNVQASLQFVQHIPVPMTNFLAALSSGYNTVLIPEQERAPLASFLTPQMRYAVSNFVQQGGKLIVHGSSGFAASFLNSAFHYALTEAVAGISTRAPGATGTLFTNGPMTLANFPLTTCLTPNTLPAGTHVIYTNNSGVTVALIERGSGQIIFLGWDWNNATPLGTNNSGWLSVLDAAVRQPPLPVHFTSVPFSQAVQPGSIVTFSAFAVGAQPVQYQWKFNGTNIPGATATNLTIDNADLSTHAGAYQVTVTDASNYTATATASLTVLVRPYVTNPPRPAIVLQGRDAQFSVTAGPTHPTLPLMYRWVVTSAAGTVTNGSTSVFYVHNCQSNGTVRMSVSNPAGVTNFFNIPLTVLADNDRDGIADSWETFYGLSTTNAADALEDIDRDGMNNLGEYLSGTNPTNELSVLRLTLLSPVSTVYFDAESNRAYVVEVRTNVASGPWIPVQTFGPSPTPTRVHVSPPNALPPEYFYRVWTPGTNGP